MSVIGSVATGNSLVGAMASGILLSREVGGETVEAVAVRLIFTVMESGAKRNPPSSESSARIGDAGGVDLSEIPVGSPYVV